MRFCIADQKGNTKGRLSALSAVSTETTMAAFALASVLLFGLYHYWAALLAGLFLAVALCRAAKARKAIVLPTTLPAVIIAVAVLFYLLSVFWAADRGMALLGFFKYLPVPLFMVLIATAGINREKLLQAFAYAGGLSAAACLLLGLFPVFNGILYPGGRFSGTFQYANSYGLYLLVSAVIIGTKKDLEKTDCVLCCVSFAGIFLTGSRSLLVLALATAAVLLFVNRKAVLAMACGIPVAVALSWALGIAVTVQRSANVSFESGEWLTRLAYYQDGIRLIAQYPFGMGHSGWWYVQPATQTAVYNVRLIHSWPLQVALDIGILPVAFLIAAAAAAFFHKKSKLREKLLLILILGHSLIDFNMAFLAVMFVLVLLIPGTRTVKIYLSGKRLTAAAASCCIAVVAFAWLGTASLMSFAGLNKVAATAYPLYTEAMERVVALENNPEEAYRWAGRILENNKFVYGAYDVKARVYASEGDWLNAVRMKQESLALSRLHGESYDELLMYIHYAMQKAEAEGDVGSYAKLKRLAIGIPGQMEDVDRSMSSLAYRLKHKPKLTLSEQSEGFLGYLRSLE